jgi:glycosyltransferase involved in cell wall biosynthesis
MIKVCIVSTLKNEAKVVSRLYASVADIADAVFVCDTGSTDKTPEKIRKVVAEHIPQIPVEIVHHPWTNFGINRTWTSKRAREWVKNFSNEKWIFIVLDGDMTLSFDSPSRSQRHACVQRNARKLFVESPAGGTYLCEAAAIRYSGQNLDYFQTFVFPDHVIPRYRGVVHECPECSYRTVDHRLVKSGSKAFAGNFICDGFTILDFNDGGCKEDKWVRDILLLGAELARNAFYMAMSLFHHGQYYRAQRWYEQRVELGGFPEECFKSLLGIAQCKEAIFRKVHVDTLAPPDNIVPANIFTLACSQKPADRNSLAHQLINLDIERKRAEKSAIRKHLGDGDPATTDLGPVPTVHEVMMAYVKAAEYRPTRAFEAYGMLFKFFRESGQDVEFFLRGILIDAALRSFEQTPYPATDMLFIQKDMYYKVLPEEVGITLFYLKRYQDSFRVNSMLAQGEWGDAAFKSRMKSHADMALKMIFVKN